MDGLRVASGVLLGLVGGCIGHVERDPANGATTTEEVTSRSRGGQVSRLCDGTLVSACEGPFTGSECDLPCLGGPGSTLECGLDRTCHSDGSTYGLATRNAVLYVGSADDDPATVQADFVAWIVDHPTDLGLAPGLTADDLELHRIADLPSAAGPLTLVRFEQTYRGIPVLAPDGIVTLVYGPQGAIAITGAILDGRAPYDHADMQAEPGKAVRSMLVHASVQAQRPVSGLEIVHATPMAMPIPRAIGWAGFVRAREGGAMLARVIVDADPSVVGAVQPLWSYRELSVSGLDQVQGIETHGLDPAAAPAPLSLAHHSYADHTTLTTGAPLLGSVDDGSQDVQLATERVVLLELHGESVEELLLHATRVLDAGGAFLADTGPQLAAQTAYHLFQSWYDYIDGHLTDPVSGAKRWDSANLLYSNGGYPSDTPPGTYSPRVLVFSNASPTDCPVAGVACANYSSYAVGQPEAMSFPELAHIPPGASQQEATGDIILPGEGIEPGTLAHELGHIIDLFTGGGITQHFAPDCGATCVYQCIEDTTDEAPPLTESIAQLFAFVFLLQSFDGVDFEHCSIVDYVSRNGMKPWTPGACIPPGEDISLFQRPDSCAKADPYCDKPDDVGVRQACCFDDEDLSECTILLPETCQIGATGSSGGMGTGTARPVPTGLCEMRKGYATNSLFQAFWQLLNGQRCDPTPPFACVSAPWGAGVDPMDATTAAFLYALRINALTYQQLFDAMATYVSCTYGPAAHAEFNAIVCNHGIRDCAEPAPMVCEDCGNDVREGTEECDGADWIVTSCDQLPQYSGGTLACDQSTCMLDHSQCTMPGLDTTAGAASPEDDSTTTGAELTTDTEPGAVDTGSAGCGCRAPASGGWTLLFPLSLLGTWRRRRAV